MDSTSIPKRLLLDGSRLIVEACVQAGANVFVGYPITPANLIYTYSSQRFPSIFAAPDEITALQWACGLSASGRLPVTATSFPGFALMLETINMAYMMELPVVIILVQRLGPSTGSATTGAQGDLLLLHGAISGGYPLPVFCISSLNDCWMLTATALDTAVKLNTPVVLLTSKEMVMTQSSFDTGKLPKINLVEQDEHSEQSTYLTYKRNTDLTRTFLPIGNDLHQVRLNASTHDEKGILCATTQSGMQNTLNIMGKIINNTPILYELDEQENAKILILSYDISSGACREALARLRAQGKRISLLIPQTMLPVPEIYYHIVDAYENIIFVEGNLQGQYAKLLYGQHIPDQIKVITQIGKMINPELIIQVIDEL